MCPVVCVCVREELELREMAPLGGLQMQVSVKLKVCLARSCLAGRSLNNGSVLSAVCKMTRGLPVLPRDGLAAESIDGLGYSCLWWQDRMQLIEVVMRRRTRMI